MSDHDRGAYTPQPDAPLSFDARVSRDRRPLPIMLFASCGILVTLVIAVFLLYRSGSRSGTEPTRQVGEPITSLRAPPPVDANTTADAPTGGAAGGATFAPPPEQPIDRKANAGLTVQPTPEPQVKLAQAPPPTSPAQTVPAPKPVAVASPAAAPAPVPVKASAPAPVTQVAPAPKPVQKPVAKEVATAVAKPTPKPVIAKVAAEPSKPVVKPKPKPVAAEAFTPNADGSAFVVQIGAYLTRDLAKQALESASGLMGAKGHGHASRVQPVVADGATRYRSQVTGFADRVAAAAYCTALKGKGHDCIVKPAQ